MEVKIKLKHPGVKLPTYGSVGAACFDIFPDFQHGQVQGLDSDDTITLPTGLFFEIPEGKALLVYSRSGQGFNYNTRLSNSVGVIDSDFRGELKVKLRMDGDGYMSIKAGTAIAQGMIVDAPQVSFCVVDKLSDTERGAGGFGSTDKKGN